MPNPQPIRTNRPAPASLQERTQAAHKARPRSSKALPEKLPDEGFVVLALILLHVPVGKTTWLQGVKSGRFPKPVYVGRSTFWKVADIRQVIADIEAGTLPPPRAKKAEENPADQDGQRAKSSALPALQGRTGKGKTAHLAQSSRKGGKANG